MGAYLAIVRGLITFANYVAQRLQQHHDEINGGNAKEVVINENTTKVLEAVSAPVSAAERDKLWSDNEQKFKTDSGSSNR